MPVDLTVSRSWTFAPGGDSDNDGVIDPGEVIRQVVRIENVDNEDATGVSLTDTLTGATLVPGSVQITPIANDDAMPSIVGNTPITFTAAQLLGNDVDPDGAQANLVITNVSSAANGTIVNNGDGTFTFTPTTGFVGQASFQYTVTDEDGLSSVSTGTVSFDVTDPVWYVDASYAGANGPSDGSYLRPFTSLTQLNGGNGDGSTNDDVDNANDTIFVYNSGTYTSGITLEAGQKLIGDGQAFVVNGIAIGANGTNTVLNQASGTIVTLGSDNVIAGINLGNGTGTATALSGNNIGTLTVNGVAIDAGGQALNLSNGSFAGTGFTSTSSDSGTNNVSLTNINGNVDLGETGTLSGATEASVNIVNTTGSVVNTGLEYNGNITQTNNAALINVDGGTAGHTGTITLTGTKTATNGTGINFENADGIYTITGTTTLNGGNAGIDIVSNAAGNGAQGSSGNFTFGGNFSITSPTGVAINITDSTAAVNADIDVTQANNFAALNISNHSGGTVTFQTTASFNVTNGSGLQFNNADAIYQMSSASTLGGVDGGIDILADSSGSFTFLVNTSINNSGAGAAFTVDNSDANVTFGGSITDSSGRAVSINEHDAGTINFTNQSSITATGGTGQGIHITNSNGGSVTFNGQVQLNTGANTAVTLTNNGGSTVTFNADDLGLDIVTTSGRGIDATGGGTINVTGTGNSITSTGGRALNVENTTIGASDLNFVRIDANGGDHGIYLRSTGSTGGLTVTGNGATVGQGGTIQNTTIDGIYLNGTADVSLNGMIISNTGQHGVYGTGVTNVGNSGTVNNSFSFTNGRLDSPGNGDNESGFFFDQLGVTNITGRMTISGTTIQNFEDVGIHVGNQSGNLVINITDVVFENNSATNGEEGIDIDASGTADTRVNLTGTLNNTTANATSGTTRFVNMEGGAFNGTAHGTGKLDVNVTGTYTTGTGGADNFPTPPVFTFSAEGSQSTITFDITGNTIRDNAGDGIFIGHEGTLTGRILNNAIIDLTTGDGIRIDTDASGTAASTILIRGNIIDTVGGDGIQVLHRDGTKPMNLTIDNNVIRNTVSEGIRVFVDEDVNAGGPDLNVAVTNNVFTNVATNGFDYGIVLQSQDPNVDLNTHITGNSGLSTAAGRGILLQQGLSSVTTSSASSAAALSGANGGVHVDLFGTVTFGVAVTVTEPTNPIAVAPDADEGGEAPATPPVTGPRSEDGDAPATPTGSGTPPAPPTEGPRSEEGDAPAADTPATPTPTPAPADPAHPVIVDDGVLSQAELDYLVEAAIARWAEAGASDAQLAAMRAADIVVADMSGNALGLHDNGTIYIDNDGARIGWFLDTTPGENEEYAGTGTRLTATADGGAAGKIDLLTVVMHELGHQAGLGDTYLTADAQNLMYGYVYAGERRLPADGQADGAIPGDHDHAAYALGPTAVGTLPAGKIVDVIYQVTIDPVTNQVLTNPLLQTATVTYTNPGATPYESTQVLTIDALSIGNLVFRDVNRNGVFDAGTDSGIAGVALSLYVDANDDGVADGAAIATTTTDGSGLYSFYNLAPGTYIVGVDAANMTGVLAGLYNSDGDPDPDDNVDNDDNGVFVGAGAAVLAEAITIAYNQEPTPGTGNDTNNTVDFGFRAINQAPSLTTVAPQPTYTENDPTIQIAPNVIITDADSPNFGGGTLTVAFTSGATAGDELVLGFGGNLTAGVGGSVLYNGTQFAVVTGADATSITFALDDDASADAVAELIERFGYRSSSDAPTSTPREITFTLVDGDGTIAGGQDTGTLVRTITVTPVNDAPTATNLTQALSFTEDQGALALGDIVVTDLDGVATITATLTLSDAAAGSLSTGTFGSATSTYNAGVWTVTGSVADVNAALAAVSFTPAADYNGSLSITTRIRDEADAGPADGTITLTGTAVNDPVTGTAPATLVLDEDAVAVAVTGLSIADVDAVLAPAGVYEVTLSSTNGTLTLATITGLTFTTGAGTSDAVMTFHGTLADINAALASASYTPTANYHGSAQIQLQVTDTFGGIVATGTGAATNDSDTIAVTVNSINDVPTATNLTQALSYTEDQGALALDDIVVTDADTDAVITATLTLSDAAAGALSTGTFGSATSTYNAGTGMWTVTGSQADVNAALAAVSFTPAADYNASVTITTRVRDEAGAGPADGTITLTGTAIEDDPVAVADSDSVLENATVTIDVTANDTDVDGGQKDVVMINGSAAVVGTPIALASGARVTLNADGTLTYNPNGAFNYLISAAKAAATGAINTSADDSFTYSLNGGSQTSVTVTVNGVDGMGDRLVAPPGDTVMTGTPDPDTFILTAAGDHDVSGLASNDGFYFGSAFGPGDQVDGGDGTDQVGLRGNYSLTFAATAFANVEVLALLTGSDARFEAAGGPSSYNLTSVEENVTAGGLLIVNGNGLTGVENFTFNGSAETDGSFLFFGGLGTETLTGGAGNDGFFFGEGRFNPGDTINGGAGADDQLALRGNFTLDFNAVGYTNALTNIDTIALLSSVDTRFGNGSGPFSYNITLNDAAVAAGARLNVNGAGLLATEQMVFSGADETNGSFRIIGGAGDDILIGGAGADLIFGGIGADQMTGNGGVDLFIYYDAAESTNALRDTLFFEEGVDKIDLRGIDAITGGADDLFTFIGTTAFDGVTAGQLRIENQGGNQWLVQGDVNGDGIADLEILVNVSGSGSLTGMDFYP